MKALTENEIKFIKETGWTPTVEQCNEWKRTIFPSLFNQTIFKKKYLDEDGYVVDEFSNKVNEYVLKTYNIDTAVLYKKFTEASDSISLEDEATYLFYTFFTKEELERLTDEEATKWLQNFQYYSGYRKWDGGNLPYVNDAIRAHQGEIEFYEEADGDISWRDVL